MTSPLYFYEGSGDSRLLIIDFRGRKGNDLIASFREVAEHVRTQPPGTILSMTLAAQVEYSPQAMKAALDLARNNGRYVKKSAIVGLDHLTGLVNIINRLTGRSIRAFHDEEVARSWLLET